MTLRSDRGSTIPLLIGYCFIGLMVIVVVVAATSLYIERKRLFTLADGAALAATENFSVSQVRSEIGRLSVHLSSEQVRQASARYLREASVESVRLLRAESPDGSSARVTVATEWEPPVLSELIPWRLPLQVTATARTVFR